MFRRARLEPRRPDKVMHDLGPVNYVKKQVSQTYSICAGTYIIFLLSNKDVSFPMLTLIGQMITIPGHSLIFMKKKSTGNLSSLHKLNKVGSVIFKLTVNLHHA